MRIISVGHRLDDSIATLLSQYEKRLKGSFKIEHLRLKSAPGDEASVRIRESKAIVEALQPGEQLILLDERGQAYSSEAFASSITKPSAKLVFVIGGAYGVDDTVRQKAAQILRLSDFVLPHQLALLILVEQLYRAQCILAGHPYHHA